MKGPICSQLPPFGPGWDTREVLSARRDSASAIQVGPFPALPGRWLQPDPFQGEPGIQGRFVPPWGFPQNPFQQGAQSHSGSSPPAPQGLSPEESGAPLPLLRSAGAPREMAFLCGMTLAGSAGWHPQSSRLAGLVPGGRGPLALASPSKDAGNWSGEPGPFHKPLCIHLLKQSLPHPPRLYFKLLFHGHPLTSSFSLTLL